MASFCLAMGMWVLVEAVVTALVSALLEPAVDGALVHRALCSGCLVSQEAL